MNKAQSKTIGEYITTFPNEVQQILNSIYKIIKKEAPDAVESMSYGMPAFKLNKRPLVYFAAWKNHIGFYATPAGNVAFQKEIEKYKNAKGSIQFPLDEPMPLDLIKRMVAFRVEELQKNHL